MPARKLSDYSTDELLYELLKLTRRQQWEADPLRFGCEVFSQHFSKPPAAMHRAILCAVTGAEPVAPCRQGIGESRPPMDPSLPLSPSISEEKSTTSPVHA